MLTRDQKKRQLEREAVVGGYSERQALQRENNREAPSNLPDCEDCEGDGEDEDSSECERCQGLGIDPMGIAIDGEAYIVRDVNSAIWGELHSITVCGELNFYIAENSEKAGEASTEYWRDMAENSPDEFTEMVGTKTLIQWGLGKPAGPGTNKSACSLEEWLTDVVSSVPEEEWAHYDHTERDISEVGQGVIEELGFTPTVAYRSN